MNIELIYHCYSITNSLHDFTLSDIVMICQSGIPASILITQSTGHTSISTYVLQVARAGSKKTAFANFSEICRLLKRQPKHVLQFLLAELGTTGSIDGNNCLIVKGRFQQKHFESVLRKYIKEYVTCHTCRSSETELTKDTRLFFLECKTCGSRCSVTAIKSGFTAMVGKRAALRRAAEATAGK